MAKRVLQVDRESVLSTESEVIHVGTTPFAVYLPAIGDGTAGTVLPGTGVIASTKNAPLEVLSKSGALIKLVLPQEYIVAVATARDWTVSPWLSEAVRASSSTEKYGSSPPNPGAQRLLGLPSVMATPPTVTVGTGTSAITNSVLVPSIVQVNGVFVQNPNAPFTYLGCQTAVKGQTFPDQQYLSPVNVAGLVPSGGMVAEFEFDGIQFEFWMKGTASKYRIMVDGQYAALAASAALANDGASHLILVAFAARANRRIRIEMSSSVHFGGIRVGPNDSWWPSSLPHGPRVIVLGDSFTQGTGADALLSGFHDTMGKLLGWHDVWSSGQGGTGYLNPGAFQTFRARVVTDVISQNPDIVLIAGGYNDSPTYTPAQIGAESLLLFQQIRAALPNCKIMVVEQWSANGSPSQAALDVRAAIKASLAAIAGPTLFLDTMVTTTPGANTLGWITGTGHGGATTGTGNADLYVSSDAIHPTQVGHDYYGRRFASAIAPAMPL